LIHPASDSPLKAGPRTSLLIWWLTFGQVGLESLGILTHWVTISNFIPHGGNPNDLSFSRHDKRSVITLGMHPVPLMPGVEVVPGVKTTNETIEFIRQE
jgi:hypothetical protein